jgi:hypothetical protein
MSGMSGMSGMSTSTPSDNVALVRRFYEGDFIRGNTSNLEEHLTVDFLDHDPPGPPGMSPQRGLEGVVRVMQMLALAMPERIIKVHDTIAADDRVVLRFTIEGEQRGPFPGRAAQSGLLRLDVIAILRVANGKIAERWGHVRVT